MKKTIKRYVWLFSTLYTVVITTISLPCFAMEIGAQEDIAQHFQAQLLSNKTHPRNPSTDMATASPTEITQTPYISEYTYAELDERLTRFITSFHQDQEEISEQTRETFTALIDYFQQNRDLYDELVLKDSDRSTLLLEKALGGQEIKRDLPQNPQELCKQLNIIIRKPAANHQKNKKKPLKKQPPQKEFHLISKAIALELPLTFSAILTIFQSSDQYALQDSHINYLIQHSTSHITTEILSNRNNFLLTDEQKISILHSNKLIHNIKLYNMICQSIHPAKRRDLTIEEKKYPSETTESFYSAIEHAPNTGASKKQTLKDLFVIIQQEIKQKSEQDLAKKIAPLAETPHSKEEDEPFEEKTLEKEAEETCSEEILQLTDEETIIPATEAEKLHPLNPKELPGRFFTPIFEEGRLIAIIRILKVPGQMPIANLPNKKVWVTRDDYAKDTIEERFVHRFPSSVDHRIQLYGIETSVNPPPRSFEIPAQIFFKDRIYAGYFEYAVNERNQCFHRFFRGYTVSPAIFAHDIDITPELLQTLSKDQLNLCQDTVARARRIYRHNTAFLEQTFTA